MKLPTPKTRPTVIGLSLALSLSVAGSARAEDDYCAKVRARAGSDTALLYAPQVRFSGVKIPQIGAQVDPTSVGTTYQVRGELVMSATNLYKGTVMEKAADADCDAHRNVAAAQELLAHGTELGRLGALREELRYLDAQKPTWDAISAKMQERLEAKTATLVDVDDVRNRVMVLERQRAQVRGDLERLMATGFDPATVEPTGISRKVVDETSRLEHELTHVRAVDPWDVSVMGGYVPPVFSAKNDWYGVLQITYSLGGPWHGSRDTRYLEARERELKAARYELPHQLEVLKKNLEIASSQARTELGLVTVRIEQMAASRAQLAQSESALAPHALASLDLDLIASGADKTFLEGLLRELGRIQEK